MTEEGQVQLFADPPPVSNVVQDFDSTKCEALRELRESYSSARERYSLLESEPGLTLNQIMAQGNR